MAANVNMSWASTAAKTEATGGPEYGTLHPLFNRASTARDITDIIAVHGLNGHYEKTWTEGSSQYNWLRDSLSQADWSLQRTRVLSFSYNSKIKKSKSTADIYDFADQLLESLLLARQQEEEQLRPIIFVCHSLGGIVFKQVSITLVLSEKCPL
jgi:alpha-beta hydrolase superfamily lysophospholipase